MSMLWMVSDHLCRHCGIGRILTRKTEYGQWLSKCSNCGTCKNTTKELCFCGADYKKSEKPTMLRCVRNAAVSKDSPHEIVIERTEVDHEDTERTRMEEGW